MSPSEDMSRVFMETTNPPKPITELATRITDINAQIYLVFGSLSQSINGGSVNGLACQPIVHLEMGIAQKKRASATLEPPPKPGIHQQQNVRLICQRSKDSRVHSQ